MPLKTRAMGLRAIYCGLGLGVISLLGCRAETVSGIECGGPPLIVRTTDFDVMLRVNRRCRGRLSVVNCHRSATESIEVRPSADRSADEVTAVGGGALPHIERLRLRREQNEPTADIVWRRASSTTSTTVRVRQ